MGALKALRYRMRRSGRADGHDGGEVAGDQGTPEFIGVPPMPTIAIYQDPSHIEGILQQQQSQGLITDLTHADDFRDTQTSNVGATKKGEIGADFKVPGFGGFSAGAGLAGDEGTTFEGAVGQQLTRNFRYTSAYYLHFVRKGLRDAGLLKHVESPTDVENLAVGDFVEFQASFRPDEIIAMMDVLNPGFVAAVMRWIRRRQLIPQMISAETEQQRTELILEYQSRPDADAELAKAIAEAIRVDFRSDATREYYGAIALSRDITAVVVCDTRSFLVEDADRILDGYFTVLGKVSTPPTKDVPVLARNKVLDRIQPEAVDWVATQLQNVATQQIEDLDAPEGLERTVEQYLDLDFPSRIKGTSFKVIPIAIYL